MQPCATILRAELARVFGDGLRLHDALGADAQRIHLAALHVAHDQVLDHLLEVGLLRFDQDVILRAERARPLIQHLRRFGIDAAGVDGHGDDRPPIVFLQPRHQERGVEAAGEGEQDRLVAGRNRVAHCVNESLDVGIASRRRSRSLRWSRPSSVAMKIVSSPEIVPTTSGQLALSMATATLWAVPVVVFTTVSDGPAVRISITKLATAANGFDGADVILGRHDVAVAGLGHAELAQVPADAGLRRIEALFAQHFHQLVLVVHGRFAEDPQDRRAARNRVLNFGDHFSSLHKDAG